MCRNTPPPGHTTKAKKRYCKTMKKKATVRCFCCLFVILRSILRSRSMPSDAQSIHLSEQLTLTIPLLLWWRFFCLMHMHVARVLLHCANTDADKPVFVFSGLLSWCAKPNMLLPSPAAKSPLTISRSCAHCVAKNGAHRIIVMETQGITSSACMCCLHGGGNCLHYISNLREFVKQF